MCDQTTFNVKWPSPPPIFKMPRIELGTAITLNCNKLPTPTNDKYKSIQKEMKSYEATKRPPPTLTHLQNILKIIQPNSIGAEKVFSVVMTQLML